MSSTLNIYISKTYINNIIQYRSLIKSKTAYAIVQRGKSNFRKDVRTRDILSKYPRFNYDGEFSKRE